GHGLVDPRPEPGAVVAEPVEAPLDDLLLAPDQRDLLGRAEPAGGEPDGGVADAEVLDDVVVVAVEPRAELVAAAVEHGRVGPGAQRQPAVVVPDPEAPALALQDQKAGLQDLAVEV